VPEFSTEPSVEIARRLEIRGDDSSSWVVVLTPLEDREKELEGLRADLSSLLQKNARVINLKGNTFDRLREDLHRPANDIVILTAIVDLTPDKWSSMDLMRSALERMGPIIFWMSMSAFSQLSAFAPNIRSFIGPSIFALGPEGGIMTENERQNRLEDLIRHYGKSNEEIIRMGELKELPRDSHFVEWLVLLGRGDLV
jgi:hypothetical protein